MSKKSTKSMQYQTMVRRYDERLGCGTELSIDSLQLLIAVEFGYITSRMMQNIEIAKLRSSSSSLSRLASTDKEFLNKSTTTFLKGQTVYTLTEKGVNHVKGIYGTKYEAAFPKAKAISKPQGDGLLHTLAVIESIIKFMACPAIKYFSYSIEHPIYHTIKSVQTKPIVRLDAEIIADNKKIWLECDRGTKAMNQRIEKLKAIASAIEEDIEIIYVLEPDNRVKAMKKGVNDTIPSSSQIKNMMANLFPLINIEKYRLGIIQKHKSKSIMDALIMDTDTVIANKACRIETANRLNRSKDVLKQLKEIAEYNGTTINTLEELTDLIHRFENNKLDIPGADAIELRWFYNRVNLFYKSVLSVGEPLTEMLMKGLQMNFIPYMKLSLYLETTFTGDPDLQRVGDIVREVQSVNYSGINNINNPDTGYTDTGIYLEHIYYTDNARTIKNIVIDYSWNLSSRVRAQALLESSSTDYSLWIGYEGEKGRETVLSNLNIKAFEGDMCVLPGNIHICLADLDGII